MVRQPADDNTVSIAIRRTPGGKLSTRLLDADDATFATIPIRIAAPSGEADPDDDRPVVGFVVGVGVTPAMSLLRGVRPRRILHIDYGAMRRGDMAYGSYLKKTESFAEAGRPELGARWPKDGRYLPDLAAFRRRVEEKNSMATLNLLMKAHAAIGGATVAVAPKGAPSPGGGGGATSGRASLAR